MELVKLAITPFLIKRTFIKIWKKIVADKASGSICLIVDNPLRDLDGLILVAWHLAQQGNSVYLVPIYDQGFDILALKPNIVLANYARSNNINLLNRFHNAGVSVAILDTEGSPGEDMDAFANLVAQTDIGKFAVLYCMWGEVQRKAFQRRGAVPSEIMITTGCPRYDYCSPPLRQRLSPPNTFDDYVLINTSFPIANPRFTASMKEEQKTMVDIGYDKLFTIQYGQAIDLAYRKFQEIIKCVVEQFPDVHFVLRPHPFEDSASYEKFIKLPNFEVRQEGSSIEWLNKAKVLIHFNCLTAVEATMLGIESISLEWINSPILLKQAPPLINISQKIQTQKELLQAIKDVINGKKLPLTEDMKKSRLKLITDRYRAIDGESAKRVAQAIQVALHNGRTITKKYNLRFDTKQFFRELLGNSMFHLLRYIIEGSKSDKRRIAKSILIEDVAEKLRVINEAYNQGCGVKVGYPARNNLSRKRLFSGNTLKIYREENFPGSKNS